MIDLLKTLTRPVLAAALLLIGVSSPSMASAAAVSLPELPYAHDALSSAIDENTMRIHHGRHHQRYVNNLNRVIEADARPQGQSLQSLPANASTRSSAIHNNGGDHWNHSLFWQSMAKAGETGTLPATLMAVIERDFNSMDDLKTPFRTTGLGRFASGWSWLIVNAEGKLQVTSTANQDNPLMDVVDVRSTPLLGNDVWEHAYYLPYQNRRGDYLDAW